MNGRDEQQLEQTGARPVRFGRASVGAGRSTARRYAAGRVMGTRSRLLDPLTVALLATVYGCWMPGATFQERTVTRVSNASKTVTFVEPMVWLDSPAAETKGIRFPAGVYQLEAEDDDYFYYRAPQPIEVRTVKNHQPVDGRDVPGGLMLAKRFSLLPGGGYIDGEHGEKIMLMKLGGDFLQMEGSKWKRSK